MKWLLYIFVLFSGAFSLHENPLFAQTPPDSLHNYTLSEQADIDTTIDYFGNIVEMEPDSQTTRFIGNAEVKYKGMILRAGQIKIYWDTSTLVATPILDTTATDGKNGGEPRFIGYPVFIEDGQEMTGERMVFNFKTQKGRVTKGRTKFEEGYYLGSTVKKTDEKVFYVKSGRFSTCSLPDPHFYFKSGKMKMIPDDRVIARPIVLYIHGIPLAALPYGVFPNQKGRRSGILVPRYGASVQEGRYLRGLGYYWAASQYWDTKVELDFFERSGIMLHSTTNYALRYLLRGSVSGSIVHKNFSDTQKVRRWDVRFNHSQTLSPTMNISGSGAFVSDASYYQDFSANREQRLRREIRSNLTLTKSWPKAKNSLTVNLSRSQFLDTDGLTETFPRVTFRHGQEPLINLFRSEKSKSSTSASQKKWYENIYFSYNNQLLNRRSKTRSITSKQVVEEDTSFFQPDTTFIINKFAGAEHNVSLSAPLRLFKYFSFSQNFSYEEIWQDRKKEYFLDEETNLINTRDVSGFSVRRTFNTNISANTKLYGMFRTGHFGGVAIRHVMTPSISFQYQPDFSEPGYGYYQEIADTNGTVFRKDRFTGSVFGSTPSNGRQSVSISVNNLFQMKTGSGDNEKKFDLFTYSLSTGYNFKLDSLQWSDIRSSLRASPSRVFNFTLGIGHSLYKYGKNGKVNQFIYKDNPWRPVRLTDFSLSSSLKLNNKMFDFGKEGKATETDSIAGELDDQVPPSRNAFGMQEAADLGDMSWQANLSLSYRLSKFNPNNVNKSIWLNMNGNIQLTKNWRVTYTARYDVKKKIMVAQDISVYRDLHCWEASFSWTPTGPYKRFYFKINIKSSILSDIKLEKRGGRSTVFGY